MSADIADRLRAIARDHLEGRSTLQGYRRLRAQLLDRLVASASGASPDATQPRATVQAGEGARSLSRAAEPAAAQLRASEPRAAAHPAEVTQPRAAALATATDGDRSGPPSLRQGAGRGRVAGYGALVILLASSIGFLFWRHHSHGFATPHAGDTGGGTSAAAGSEPAGHTDPIRALLQPLLESPDWSDARLLALNEALLEAGRPRIEAVRDTEWFDTVLDSVRSRLLQQQALAGTPLTPDRSPLAALAVTLGIDLTATADLNRVASVGAQGETGHASSAGSPQAAPRVASRVVSREKTGGPALAPGTSGAETSSPAKTESSATPRHISPAAGNHLVTASGEGTAEGAASGTGEGLAAAEASEATSPAAASANATTSAPSAGQKTSAHHEYPACSAALSEVRLNYCQDFLDSGEPAPLLVLIPSGSFMMGNSDAPAEGPVHRVTLAHDFAMSAYEVSQSEFQLYCRTAGRDCPQQPWTRGDYPVVDVSWREAQDYAKWLSAATHHRYRLPTEAEWEYAARAGRTGLYPSGDSLSPTDAYFSMGQTLSAPAPRSMRFNANAWHLMHMVGNVREWVEDAWSPTFAGAPDDGSARSQGDPGMKVVRGGCYADPAIKLRLTTREALAADTRDRCTGIRLVREIQ
ncbi:MAG TPA: formylglycine-generating enzyme family protein [Steroidobacteraceae bacterium]|nr:formylglycine-generating enzyme family protein [Steroidobacteraceae bacterium]